MAKTGRVYKSTGSNYKVKSGERFYDVSLAGKFRLEGIKSTNPVAVGDEVLIENDCIEEVFPRKNYMIRQSTNLSKRTHILASNLDRVMIVASISKPRTSTGFIDRVLVTCEAYSIPAMIVFNKSDLLDSDEIEYRDELMEEYRFLGYPTFSSNALTKEGVDELKEELKDKNTLVIGHSGVGKSSLLNAIQPGLSVATGSISRKHQKGMHTTTFAEMFDLNIGGTIVDTPGIKEFGLVRMRKEEIGDYFPEIFRLKGKCKYNNCLHINEPGCAVLEGLEVGALADFRYKNYVNFVETTSYTAWADD